MSTSILVRNCRRSSKNGSTGIERTICFGNALDLRGRPGKKREQE